MEPRYYTSCDAFNIFQGQLVSFGSKERDRLPSLSGVDPDLAFLIKAMDHERQEVRDVAAFAIGLLGPSAKAALPFLEAKFRTPSFKGGWYNLALQNVSCEPVGSPNYERVIPDSILSEAQEPAPIAVAKLYLDPKVEFPPGMLSVSFDTINIGSKGAAAAPQLAQILDANVSVQKKIDALRALNELDATFADDLPILIRLANEGNDVLRWEAGAALVRLGHPSAIPLLGERIRDDDWAGDWSRDICKYGRDAITAEEKILAVLQRTDWPRVQYHAVDTLACIRSEKSLPTLTKALTSGDWKLQERAAVALAEIGIASPEVVEPLSALTARHWFARVRKAAYEALAKLRVEVPPPPGIDKTLADEEIIFGGPPNAIDHGLPWCDESGRYSIDGMNWFMVKWVQPSLERIPSGFPRKNVFLQTIGTHSFLRVSDGWLFGSNGFEAEGTFVHVSDKGTITEWESERGSPFGHAAINGIIQAQGKYFAFGFEILKVGYPGALFEIAKGQDI